jgi:lysophospholipase L1-like esterase
MASDASASSISLLNQAAGGNRVLADGLGPNALGRLDRDVLAHSSVRFALLFEGVNDLGTAPATTAAQQAVADRLIWAYKQLALRAHAQGVPLFGATITPFGGAGQAYADPTREAARQRVNAFVRTGGAFDAVVDFDAAVRDAANPAQLAAKFDSGDHLHLNVAGYQAMADAFPLGVFTQFAGGVYT